MLFVGFVGDWVTDGYEYSYPVPGELCVGRHIPFTAGPPWRFGGPAKLCDDPHPSIGSPHRHEISRPGDFVPVLDTTISHGRG